MADRQSTHQGSEDAEQPDRTPRANRAKRVSRVSRGDRADKANGAYGSRLNAAEAGRDALRQLVDLTGKEPEGVSGVEPSEDGWIVTVDVVEDRRIPSTSDVLASYEAELDQDGELISYRRVRRYARGRGDDGTG